MEKPLISWYIKENEDYVQDNEYYLGSFNALSDIIMQIQVWNNRYGNSNVESMQDAKLSIYFSTAEDSILLNYCSVAVNDNDYIKPEIELNKATINIGLLDGSYNNGLENNTNKNNYKDLKIKFTGLPANLQNGLKNMFVDIEFD